MPYDEYKSKSLFRTAYGMKVYDKVGLDVINDFLRSGYFISKKNNLYQVVQLAKERASHKFVADKLASLGMKIESGAKK